MSKEHIEKDVSKDTGIGIRVMNSADQGTDGYINSRPKCGVVS
jgi:hypothetical protein